MERFCCKTRILSGPEGLKALGQLGIKRLLLVTDPFFAKNGVANSVAARAKAEAVEIFDGVQPDPSVELVARGTGVLQRFGPDTVVALGGGSAMDCAKAMAYFGGRSVQLIAIPTTSGSGSEVTDFAVLTHEGVKYPLVDERLQPQVAILDPGLLEKLPPGLIADSGFDVLAHALEAYTAKNAGAISDALARDAFCAAFTALPASFAGDARVRERIHLASTMAGMAFSQAGLGLCHAISHALGGAVHLPHGRLNAIALPLVMDYNTAAAGKRYAQLSRGAGLEGSVDTVAIRNLKRGLVSLRRSLGLPVSLAQAGVDCSGLSVEQLTQAVLADPCCATNPAPVTAEGVRRLLTEMIAYG